MLKRALYELILFIVVAVILWVGLTFDRHHLPPIDPAPAANKR
jgi:hypothetical protein